MRNFKSLTPLLNRVLVKRILPESKTASGIILTSKTSKDSKLAEVISVGPGIISDKGVSIPISVKVGDHVILPDYEGTRVPLTQDKEAEFLLYKDSDILAIVEDFKKI